MTDLDDDTSPEEWLRRFDEAVTRLRVIAEAEEIVRLEHLAETAPVFSWPPAPNTAHPSLERQAASFRQLMKDGSHTIYWMPPRRVKIFEPLEDDLLAVMPPQPIALTVRQAYGPAPFVGHPFIWLWKVAVDDQGRWVSADSVADYDPRWRP